MKKQESIKFKPINMAYALTWKCYCKCPICHSGRNENNNIKEHIDTWKKNISSLIKYNGPVRLTLTGGEPMVFWDKTDELTEFIKYLHKNNIHVCLNTTGVNMNADKLEILDKYIDTILLSVRGFTIEEISREFGINEKNAKILRDTQLMILHEIHKTNIRLEVATVVTKENYHRIDYLGDKLCAINKNIIWRIEEYYRNGKQVNQPKDKFDLEAAKYDEKMIDIYKKHSNNLTIRHSSKESRLNAPDPFLFPDGILHSTSDHSYRKICHINEFDFTKIETRRDWTSYKNSMRDWGWERDKY
jgi:MoaA/NifB/PqqE/SkfB family radical SAM enzyme